MPEGESQDEIRGLAPQVFEGFAAHDPPNRSNLCGLLSAIPVAIEDWAWVNEIADECLESNSSNNTGPAIRLKSLALRNSLGEEAEVEFYMNYLESTKSSFHYPEIVMRAGSLLQKMGLFEEALRYYQNGLDVLDQLISSAEDDPEWHLKKKASILFYMGQAHRVLGETEIARLHYQDVVLMSEGRNWPLWELGPDPSSGRLHDNIYKLAVQHLSKLD